MAISHKDKKSAFPARPVRASRQFGSKLLPNILGSTKVAYTYTKRLKSSA